MLDILLLKVMRRGKKGREKRGEIGSDQKKPVGEGRKVRKGGNKKTVVSSIIDSSWDPIKKEGR